ncbi:MAG: rhodanese-like domain-containing protein [Terriglobales bacterium]
MFALIVLFIAASTPLVRAADSTDMKTITPAELNDILKATGSKDGKPLVFQVGSHMLYEQAHIQGSEYIGAGNTAEGLRALAARVSKLSKGTPIVLYRGCCPWSHCPNVNPAYDALRQLGFRDVKVLYIANNFGADWVDKGYPAVKGQK